MEPARPGFTRRTQGKRAERGCPPPPHHLHQTFFPFLLSCLSKYVLAICCMPSGVLEAAQTLLNKKGRHGPCLPGWLVWGRGQMLTNRSDQCNTQTKTSPSFQSQRSPIPHLPGSLWLLPHTQSTLPSPMDVTVAASLTAS